MRVGRQWAGLLSLQDSPAAAAEGPGRQRPGLWARALFVDSY
ncbi:hypothetical protein [Paractinoplanes atraurantiacus]|uniref:Uncharacterized protein n=1 Tax=Paractinoplanes atraurantiacus TaxID=1036182 RepID=A0A285FQ33_9ACTN|nr:hypothetical protein [Actinoplanes atraurantiacus]SNY12331.1 hypothetical protein SAMN05421748_1011021 [Actinoplanes atraurantiacus]